MKMRFCLVVAFSVLALGATGCKKVKEMVAGQRAGTSDGRAGADASELEEEALAEKLNAYIECMNFVSKSFHDSERRYFSWADEVGGPTGAEQSVGGLLRLGDTSTCVDGLNKAKTAKPSLPTLEAAGAAYVAALTKAEPLLTEAHDYYAQSDYRDDKMAKGKALHPKLVALFDEFDKADVAMGGEVRTLSRRLQERTLASLEKAEGRKIPYLHQALMLYAQDVLELGKVSKIQAIELAKFGSAIEEYEKSVNELSAYVGAHKDEAGRFNRIGSIVERSKTYLIAAKELMRRARDKAPFSDSEVRSLSGPSGWTVDGSPAKLLYTYNMLVMDSNMVSGR